MAFTNRLNLVVPGFGTPISNDTLFLSTGVALSTASSPVTTTITGFTPALKSYYVRVKIYGGATAAGTITGVGVVVSDGTTFVAVANVTPIAAVGGLLGIVAGPAGDPYTNTGVLGTSVGGLDFLFPVLTDLAITQMSVYVTMTGATATAKMDIEISGSN
jgi:hypothetical protein